MYRSRLTFSFVVLFLAAISVTLLSPEASAQSLSQGNGDLRVMTYNVDEGTDYLEIEAAQSPFQFLVAVGQTIAQVRATNPPARMQAVASQILAAGPALVSLQEVDQWYTGTFDGTSCGAMTLEFDMLQELLTALAAQGGHYAVANAKTEIAFPPTPGLLPPFFTPLCGQVVDFNVILARTDLDPPRFSWSNPQSGTFNSHVSLNSPFGLIPIDRVWVSVDAMFNGNAFRFLGTHLESIDAGVREQQGGELRAGPANTPLPVIIAMDSNAQAAPLPQDPTYLDFLVYGYKDAWSEVFPNDEGFTCCQAQLVNNPVSQLYQRIDLILTLGSIEAQNIALFGNAPGSMTSAGIWPSDHAGVAAQMIVQRGD